MKPCSAGRKRAELPRSHLRVWRLTGRQEYKGNKNIIQNNIYNCYIKKINVTLFAVGLCIIGQGRMDEPFVGEREAMDSVLITTAITSVRTVKDSLEIALGYNTENDSRKKIAYSLHQIGVIHDTLFYVRNELSRLHVENEQLRQELKHRKP
jgi:hypothetical protein